MNVSRIRIRLSVFAIVALIAGVVPGVSAATSYWLSERTPTTSAANDLDVAIRSALQHRGVVVVKRHQIPVTSAPTRVELTTRPTPVDGGFKWLDAAIGGLTVGGLLLLGLVSIQVVQRGLRRPRSL